MKRWLLVALALVLAFGIVFVAGLVTPLLRQPIETTRTIDRQTVVNAIESVLRVATVEMHMSEVVTYSDRRSVLRFLSSEKNAIYRVQGRVLAGFDLDPGRLVVDVDETARRVRVRLPHARVLAIDPVVEILNESSGWMNPVTNADRNVWYRWARGDLRRAALDAGILREAELRSRAIVEALVRGFGSEVTVVFEGEEASIESEPTPEAR